MSQMPRQPRAEEDDYAQETLADQISQRHEPHIGSYAGSSIAQNFRCSVASAGAHHASTGMSRTAAQVQPLHRRAVVAVAGDRSQTEQLMQRHRTLEDIAAGQSKDAFQINGT